MNRYVNSKELSKNTSTMKEAYFAFVWFLTEHSHYDCAGKTKQIINKKYNVF